MQTSSILKLTLLNRISKSIFFGLTPKNSDCLEQGCDCLQCLAVATLAFLTPPVCGCGFPAWLSPIGARQTRPSSLSRRPPCRPCPTWWCCSARSALSWLTRTARAESGTPRTISRENTRSSNRTRVRENDLCRKHTAMRLNKEITSHRLDWELALCVLKSIFCQYLMNNADIF